MNTLGEAKLTAAMHASGRCAPGAQRPGRRAPVGTSGKRIHRPGTRASGRPEPGMRKAAVGARARLSLPRRVLLAASLLLISAAVVYAASFFVSDIVSQWRAEHEFTSMASRASAYDAAEVEAQIAKAQAYNRGVAGCADGGQEPYESQLSLAGGDVICWLEVPRLSLKVPVYRGSRDDDVVNERLMEGAVHVRGTSLPVGGDSTHAAITAHSGMRNARMFDQIDMLETGDSLVVHVLGEKLCYEVCGLETVTPEQAGELKVDSGQDLLTLVTCRPIGVNTERLLVHAKRTGTMPAETLPRTADWLMSPRTLLFAGAMAVATAVLWAGVLAFARDGRRD